MLIALATCAELPDWEVDDRPLAAALAARGARVATPAWDDPGFDWAACSGCLIRTTWDYMERHGEYLAWADRVDAVTPLHNPPAVVRWNTHKSYLRRLAAHGVDTIPTVWLAAGSAADPAALLASNGWRAGFLKPAVGATARETLPFQGDGAGLAAARAHLDRLLPHEDLMLQPFLPAVHDEGELSVVFVDGEPTHAVRKVPRAGDYRVQDDFGAHDEPHPPTPRLLAPARRALAAAEDLLGQRLLYARADFLRDPGGRLLLSELELVEPSMFFRHAPQAADRLAEALLRRLGR